MAKTKKVQVTLEAADYQTLSRIADDEGKKLAAVVRECIRKYAIDPESERTRRKAMKALLSVPPVPVPLDYDRWERDYCATKAQIRKKSD